MSGDAKPAADDAGGVVFGLVEKEANVASTKSDFLPGIGAFALSCRPK